MRVSAQGVEVGLEVAEAPVDIDAEVVEPALELLGPEALTVELEAELVSGGGHGHQYVSPEALGSPPLGVSRGAGLDDLDALDTRRVSHSGRYAASHNGTLWAGFARMGRAMGDARRRAIAPR